ncbi:hypothetical protein ACFWPH_28705 [Nocardia sp. NPDC058499]
MVRSDDAVWVVQVRESISGDETQRAPEQAIQALHHAATLTAAA